MAPKVALGAPKWLRKWLLELDWPESWPEASGTQWNSAGTVVVDLLIIILLIIIINLSRPSLCYCHSASE